MYLCFIGLKGNCAIVQFVFHFLKLVIYLATSVTLQ